MKIDPIESFCYSSNSSTLFSTIVAVSPSLSYKSLADSYPSAIYLSVFTSLSPAICVSCSLQSVACTLGPSYYASSSWSSFLGLHWTDDSDAFYLCIRTILFLTLKSCSSTLIVECKRFDTVSYRLGDDLLLELFTNLLNLGAVLVDLLV